MIAWFFSAISAVARLLDSKPWWHYYYGHAIVAACIQLAVCGGYLLLGLMAPAFNGDAGMVAGALAGFIFYLSRKICEYTYDVDPTNRWDWPGSLWPTAAVIAVTILYFMPTKHYAGATWDWATKLIQSLT